MEQATAPMQPAEPDQPDDAPSATSCSCQATGSPTVPVHTTRSTVQDGGDGTAAGHAVAPATDADGHVEAAADLPQTADLAQTQDAASPASAVAEPQAPQPPDASDPPDAANGGRRWRPTGGPQWLTATLDFIDAQLSSGNSFCKRLVMLFALTVCIVLLLTPILGAVVLVAWLASGTLQAWFAGAIVAATGLKLVRDRQTKTP